MRIAVLGTGHMATTLGSGLQQAGHTIVFGSRSPSEHQDLSADVVEHAAAIQGADVVISALAAASSLQTLSALREPLAGHVLIDIGNAVDERLELLDPVTSLGQKLQAALPGTRVVKALNTLPGTVAIDPASLPTPTSVFLAGDDEQAKALVSNLIGDLGWPQETRLDLGGITAALAMERYFSLFAALMGAFRGAPFNIAVIR